jgi:hypothetical protein
MDKICFSGSLTIYEDGEDWVVIDGDTTERIKKERKPTYPLSMVIKFDYVPVNIARLKELEAFI